MKNKKLINLSNYLSITKGFTLLELLVVIGIIGILMALATVAYSSAQVGGRNARRKQDIVAIQNALEQYYSENGFNYPGTCQDADIYMKSAWPTDPSSTNTVTVQYEGVANCSTASYCICAVLEGGVSAAATSGNSGADCAWGVDKSHYCVAELQ